MPNSLTELDSLLKCRVGSFLDKDIKTIQIYQKTCFRKGSAFLYGGEWEQGHICSSFGFMKIRQMLELWLYSQGAQDGGPTMWYLE